MERPERAARQGDVPPARGRHCRASWTRRVARRQGRSRCRAGQAHAASSAGFYETALRVIGAYIDQQQPRDVFFFEQDHQFVMRLLMPTRAGLRHVLVEFTRDEIEPMIAQAISARGTLMMSHARCVDAAQMGRRLWPHALPLTDTTV